MIKLDERKIFYRVENYALALTKIVTQMLTRDLFAVANFVVLVDD